MKKNMFNKKAPLALLTSLLSVSVLAANAPAGDKLAGNFYGGVHGIFLDADNERQVTLDPNSTIDDANGVGVELGYRFDPKWEGRLSYTDLSNVDIIADGYFNEPDGDILSVDMLYFPKAGNLYGLGGFSLIDIVDDELSMNLGGGYRHYFNDRFAAYLEGAAHYQFDNSLTDFSGKIGLIYFFGTNESKPVAKAAPAPVKKAVAVSAVAPKPRVKDTDKDGVTDTDDLCANTPMTDKVDSEGCTIFTDKTATMELLINFDNNKDIVKDEYLPELFRAAKFLNTYPHVNLVIEGHSSAQGNAAYNKKLSQKRAEAVKQKLVSFYAIDADRLTAVGYGEEQLIDSSDTAEAHKLNRRIQARVETKVKEAVKR